MPKILLFLLLISSTAYSSNTKGISPFNYATGKFNPAKHSDFVNLNDTTIPHSKKNMYLRKEAVRSMQKLLIAFNKEHPGIKIQIISATRNFYSQRAIWSAKWNGKRKVTGVKNIRLIKDPVLRAKKILNYSSMPGTSRHHWGTDFDINSLNNSYFERGTGKIIYNWMKKNAGRFGFHQPYTSGRKDGYLTEKWHWSYVPLAKKYLNAWNRLYKSTPMKFKKNLKFPGAVDALKLAPIYVNSIHETCK